MSTLVLGINRQSVMELEAIRAEAVALARATESLSDAEFARLRPLLDRLFRLLARMNNNLVLVDVDGNP